MVKNSFFLMLYVVGALWLILLISLFIPLQEYGIVPRELNSLPFIFTSPFLHAGYSHLAANSITLIILGSLFISLEKEDFLFLIFLLILFGGLGTWIIGRKANHIGASGVIFGLMGYLIALGLFKRNFKTLVVSALVLVFYGGSAISGIMPTAGFISWEAHLCGFLSGIALAKFTSKKVDEPKLPLES